MTQAGANFLPLLPALHRLHLSLPLPVALLKVPMTKELLMNDVLLLSLAAGYTSTSPVVHWFWEVVREMDKQDLALLVQFVTGESCAAAT